MCILNSRLFVHPWHMIHIVQSSLVLSSRLLFACCNDTCSPNTRFLDRLFIMYHLSASQTLEAKQHTNITVYVVIYNAQCVCVCIFCIYVLYFMAFLGSGMVTLYVY